MAKYQQYTEYKDSGVEWLGDIPKEWIPIRLKHLLLESLVYGANEAAEDDNPKNPRYIRITDMNSDGTLDPNTFRSLPMHVAENYLLIDGDILLARSGATVGKSFYYKSEFGLSCFAGYLIRARPHGSKLDSKFAYWFFQSDSYWKYVTGSQIKATIQNVSAEKYGDLYLSLPKKIEEQSQIANFLDHETTKIDSLIEKQQQLIQLLKEKRQAVISHAVTKGLDPHVKMKDSGVEWLGQVPEHWNMAPVRRYLLEHRQGYYTTESYVDEGLKLLRITDLRDLGEINVANCPMVNESDTTHLFKLRKGDVVFARTGGAGSFGVITEDYENLIYASYLIRFRFMSKIFEPDYLKFLFQSDSFQLSVKQNIHGGVNQNIHAEDIKNTVVCAPSLLEQKKIVEYLEYQCLLFEDLINKASDSVKLMQERRTALISAAVTGKIDVRNWQNPIDAKTELSA